jgi:glycosyltransferase involved in cell wall biosynthesis
MFHSDQPAPSPTFRGRWNLGDKPLLKTPTVSFVVPCYNLAHFLAECVESILSQSYKNIEIIIIDDRSPDNTAEVSRSIISDHSGRMISYIVNSENLGNIRTYNRGIQLAQGPYVWILSPDDRLRARNIVEKYVGLMESEREIGYIFCPGHVIDNDRDMGVYLWSQYRKEDTALDGQQLVKDIVDSKFELLSPSVMIRKKCYEQITFFPEDMPHRGDAYVWSLIAMRYKVGYFAEAMVDYRIHSNSMMSTLAREDVVTLNQDNIAVLWRVKAEAEKQNLPHIVNHCWNAIVKVYACQLFITNSRGYFYRLTVKEFEASLSTFEANPIVRFRIRARVLGALLLITPRRCVTKLWQSVWPSPGEAQARSIRRASQSGG